MSRMRKQCERSLNRLRPFRELRKLHWIFCEGGTEEVCLINLRRHWRLSSVQISVVGQVGTPWTVVQRALEKRNELRRKSETHYTIHVVFDRDDHPRFRAAIDRACSLGFSLGVSVPCIELWGILLHQNQTAHITRHQAQHLLKNLHPGYDHERHPYFDLKTMLNGLEEASRRSENLKSRALRADNEFYNPTTSFSKVISAIRP